MYRLSVAAVFACALLVCATASPGATELRASIARDLERLERDIRSSSFSSSSSSYSSSSGSLNAMLGVSSKEEQECKLSSVILADISASIGSQAQNMQESVVNVFKELKTHGPTGVAEFAASSRGVLEIADYSEDPDNVPEALNARGNLCVVRTGKKWECPHCSGTCTNTNKGLFVSANALAAYAEKTGETAKKEPKAIFVITDGRPNRGGPMMRKQFIELAKKNNIHTYFLVVNKRADLVDRFFQTVDDTDSARFINKKHVTDYKSAVAIAKQWVSEACKKANTPPDKVKPVPKPTPKPEPVLAMSYFETSKWDIDPKYRTEEYNDFASAVKSDECKKAPVVYVRGFASPKGSASFNFWLSVMRCSSAAKELVKAGVDAAKIALYPGGEDHGNPGEDAIPADEDADDARRVEVYCGCQPPSWIDMPTDKVFAKLKECTSAKCKGVTPKGEELGEKWAKVNKAKPAKDLPKCDL